MTSVKDRARFVPPLSCMVAAHFLPPLLPSFLLSSHYSNLLTVITRCAAFTFRLAVSPAPAMWEGFVAMWHRSQGIIYYQSLGLFTID